MTEFTARLMRRGAAVADPSLGRAALEGAAGIGLVAVVLLIAAIAAPCG